MQLVPTYQRGSVLTKASKGVDNWQMPDKRLYEYALNIKNNYPDVWKLGGNEFGNQAFKNLQRVIQRGKWTKSERWFFIKWQSFAERHKQDFRINGVIACLKWLVVVDKGWQYQKSLIEKEVKKRYPEYTKAEHGAVLQDVSQGEMIGGKRHEHGGTPLKVGQSVVAQAEVGEIIINRESSARHCEELSEINQREGGVALDCDKIRKTNEQTKLPDENKKYNDGGIITKNEQGKYTTELTKYYIEIGGDTWSEVYRNKIYSDFNEAMYQFKTIDSRDFEDKRFNSDNYKILYRKADTLRFIDEIDEENETIQDYSDIDFLYDKSYWMVINDGEPEQIKYEIVGHVNKSSEELLDEVKGVFNTYAGYANIPLDDDGSICIGLRIKDHSGKWKNKERSGCKYYLSIVIANENQTKHFNKNSTDGLSPDEEYYFDSENTKEEIIEFINEKINEYKKLEGTYIMKSGGELIEGGLSDNMTIKEIADLHGVSVEQIKSQLAKGVKVEKEHTNNNAIATEIAKDHLAENPEYYDLLSDAELKQGGLLYNNKRVIELGKSPYIITDKTKPTKELREQAKEYLTGNFLNKYVLNKTTGEPIYISRKCIKKLLNNAPDEKIGVLFFLSEIIEYAIPTSVEEKKESNNKIEIKAISNFVYNFETIINVDGSWYEYSFKTFVMFNKTKNGIEKIFMYSGHLPIKKPLN